MNHFTYLTCMILVMSGYGAHGADKELHSTKAMYKRRQVICRDIVTLSCCLLAPVCFIKIVSLSMPCESTPWPEGLCLPENASLAKTCYSKHVTLCTGPTMASHRDLRSGFHCPTDRPIAELFETYLQENGISNKQVRSRAPCIIKQDCYDYCKKNN